MQLPGLSVPVTPLCGAGAGTAGPHPHGIDHPPIPSVPFFQKRKAQAPRGGRAQITPPGHAHRNAWDAEPSTGHKVLQRMSQRWTVRALHVLMWGLCACSMLNPAHDSGMPPSLPVPIMYLCAPHRTTTAAPWHAPEEPSCSALWPPTCPSMLLHGWCKVGACACSPLRAALSPAAGACMRWHAVHCILAQVKGASEGRK